MPSYSPDCARYPDDWVDCDNGYVRGTGTKCEDACNGQCCDGDGACSETTACIKKDESCSGYYACAYVGKDSSYEIHISGQSCTGSYACEKMFQGNTQGTGEISVTNSCS